MVWLLCPGGIKPRLTFALQVSGADNVNPLVLATFRGRPPAPGAQRRPRILFYGHYDVISAVVFYSEFLNARYAFVDPVSLR